MIRRWLLRQFREKLNIYPVHELQTWGHCGCCGAPIHGEVFDKGWAWGVCEKCREEVSDG